MLKTVYRTAWGCCLAAWAAAGAAWAEGQGGIAWSGYLQTDQRVGMTAPYASTWNENRLCLEAATAPTEDARFYAELWVRTLGAASAGTVADLARKDLLTSWNLDIREAYADFYHVLIPNLSVRIGRQRIAWGRGDKINPTDNINPYDLEDIWDFGRHLGSDGFKMTCQADQLTLTGVFIPIFTPAVLPAGDWLQAFVPDAGAALPAGLAADVQTDVRLPPAGIRESALVAFKVSQNDLGGCDLSLSYVAGRDDIPCLYSLRVTPSFSTPGSLDAQAELGFPRRHILGADLATSLAGVGFWAEAAVVFPEKVERVTDLSGLGLGTQTETALSPEPYATYLAGMDYTFAGRVYVNLQYLHGFISERGREALEDYIFMNADWEAIPEVLKITPVGIGLEAKKLSDVGSHYSFIAMPQMEYRPFDNAMLVFGGRWINGTAGTHFGNLTDRDEIYCRVKYFF